MQHPTDVQIPRIAITFCTGCRWNLRAAYYCQELLATFGTSIGEVALIPATGGVFTVRLTHRPLAVASSTAGRSEDEVNLKETLIWDRKVDGGFPETKILKQRIRDHIQPGKNLGHSDTPSTQKPLAANGADQEADGLSSQVAEGTSISTKDKTSDTVISSEDADVCVDCA